MNRKSQGISVYQSFFIVFIFISIVYYTKKLEHIYAVAIYIIWNNLKFCESIFGLSKVVMHDNRNDNTNRSGATQ